MPLRGKVVGGELRDKNREQIMQGFQLKGQSYSRCDRTTLNDFRKWVTFMHKNIALPAVCSMDFRERKVEERNIKQMSRKEAGGLELGHDHWRHLRWPSLRYVLEI